MTILNGGAGPLAAFAANSKFGAYFQVVDRHPDQVHESRALAIQPPHTLEILASLGLADAHIERSQQAWISTFQRPLGPQGRLEGELAETAADGPAVVGGWLVSCRRG